MAEGREVCGSNLLTLAQSERLAYLLEELGEAQQCIGKILRHGYDSSSPGVTTTNNRRDLERELVDVQAGIDLLLDNDDLSITNMIEFKRRKKARSKYFHYEHKGVNDSV